MSLFKEPTATRINTSMSGGRDWKKAKSFRNVQIYLDGDNYAAADHADWAVFPTRNLRWVFIEASARVIQSFLNKSTGLR